MPDIFHDTKALVDAVLAKVGKNIVIGLPLGLGKANTLVNALYHRACADPELSLTIYTALTLEAPESSSLLAQRFLDPLRDRFFSGYPRLAYAQALEENNLSDNINVHEFFLQPGQWLKNPEAQQSYVSLNYTHALHFLLDAGVNLITQLIAAPHPSAPEYADRYSLSCNPDISADLLDLRSKGEFSALVVGEINQNLPFMHGAANRSAEDFDFILDQPGDHFSLFMPPHQPVTLIDHAIALHVARLVPDGGTLQIGIGSIGDAIASALILRHKHNAVFRELAQKISHNNMTVHDGVFQKGLYGLSEMLVEGFLELINEGVLTRQVDGRVIHAGFFLASPVFYKTLATMDAATQQKIAMMPVSYVNELYGDEMEKRRARTGARFINSGIMATLNGAVVSDGTDNGQVISGVGGQYNFVAQAFALSDARSIITLRATRTQRGKVTSNIVWSYGHITIPRHLRDVVVTEYGVADLRGKSDAEVIAAMLNITDSRFQQDLLEQAQKAGKIAADYRMPDIHQNNTPERIAHELSSARAAGYLQPFPLGSDFTETEQQLAYALKVLSENTGSKKAMAQLFYRGLFNKPDKNAQECLERMKLDQPGLSAEFIYKTLLLGALQKTRL